jgi:endonuclease/exonuclease/phosphatase family metal-dependent hydrolase
MNLQVATFNINKDDGDFPNRIKNLSTEIIKYDIDILCLQEDYNNEHYSSSDEINDTLKYYKITLQTRKKSRKNIQSSSNLTILSKYKPFNNDYIYFNKNIKEQRACLFVSFNIENQTILVVNTHLCHLNSKNRLEQIEGILDYIKNKKFDLVFFCGDFNSSYNSKEIKMILKNDFTYNNEKITSSRGEMIDYIFYKEHYECLFTNIVLKKYSDHYCLINKFRLL